MGLLGDLAPQTWSSAPVRTVCVTVDPRTRNVPDVLDPILHPLNESPQSHICSGIGNNPLDTGVICWFCSRGSGEL